MGDEGGGGRCMARRSRRTRGTRHTSTGSTQLDRLRAADVLTLRSLCLSRMNGAGRRSRRLVSRRHPLAETTVSHDYGVRGARARWWFCWPIVARHCGGATSRLRRCVACASRGGCRSSSGGGESCLRRSAEFARLIVEAMLGGRADVGQFLGRARCTGIRVLRRLGRNRSTACRIYARTLTEGER